MIKIDRRKKQHVNIDRGKQYLAGEIIFQQGHAPTHFYIIQQGNVECYLTNGLNNTITNRLGPGDFFGEEGLISSEPRLFSCKAITFVEVTRINIDDFQKLLKSSHPLIGSLINLLLRGLKNWTNSSTKETIDSPIKETFRENPVNNFYIMALLLDLNFRSTLNDGILKEQFIKQTTLVFNIFSHQAKEILQQFVDFGLIRIEKPSKKSAFSSFVIEREKRIFNMSNNLLNAAKRISENSNLLSPKTSDLQLIEVKEALELYNIDSKKFYRKMSNADFPDHLFFINKLVLSDLVKDKGKVFFEKPSIKNINDIKYLDDLIFIDKKSIQLALQETEVYDLAKLITSASAEINDLLMGCFSSRMRTIIETTANKIIIDDLEVQELEKNFIDVIKRIKTTPFSATR